MANRRPRLFTFASGGWVLAVAVGLSIAGVAWNLAPLFSPDRVRPRGDGRNPASYGFDLAHAIVPPERIASSGLVADALRALDDPATWSLAEIQGRYLVGDDKVIGVVFGGEARAYPLRVLVWHEVVNDVVAGVPIAVTYNAVSHGIAVFDRRAGGGTLTFRVSGLLYQSNLLMYDRQGESLWSQLQARAIAGPAAGTSLTVLPLSLSRWDAWSAAWPQTRVLAPLAAEREKYSRDLSGSFAGSEALRFPVDPMPPPGRPLKTVVFAPLEGEVVPLEVAPGERRLEVRGRSGTVPEAGLYAFWFAWYATRPAP